LGYYYYFFLLFFFIKQQPSRLKYRKNHKVSRSFFFLDAFKNFFPLYGTYALKSLSYGKLTFKQIESGRKSIRRNINKRGSI
jgi:ribosomal protein L16/L10AE